jgi:hypothetical protein
MEEEPEIQDSTSVMGVPTSVEEQLNTETSKPTKLNKNGKPRKQLSPEALERLAKAREKANAMRQQAYAKKLEEKVEKIKIKNEEVLTETTNEVIDPEPAEVKDVVEKKVKPKEKGKKKTKIIVEQSSDDSDEFEQNDNVVFVKRVSRKKKEVPAVEPEHQMDSTTGIGVLPPPEIPRPPPRPQLTPQQRILKSQYESMFSGGFMNQGNLMRRHY